MEEIITEDIKILYRRRLSRNQSVDDFLRRWPELAEEEKIKPLDEKKKEVKQFGKKPKR